MPLHAEDEGARVRQLDTLDDVVRGPRHVAQAPPQSLDRLVMKAVDLHLRTAERRAEPRTLDHDFHRMRRLTSWRGLGVDEGSWMLARDVLDERSAERDVQHLNAAANREEW